MHTGMRRFVNADLLVFGVAVIFKKIHAVLYDRELALASGLPARAIYYGIVLAVCLGIGLAMRLTGPLMALAFDLPVSSAIAPCISAEEIQ